MISPKIPRNIIESRREDLREENERIESALAEAKRTASGKPPFALRFRGASASRTQRATFKRAANRLVARLKKEGL